MARKKQKHRFVIITDRQYEKERHRLERRVSLPPTGKRHKLRTRIYRFRGQWRSWLFKLIAGCEENKPNRIFANCRPAFAYVPGSQWLCRQTWLCPFCRARMASTMYETFLQLTEATPDVEVTCVHTRTQVRPVMLPNGDGERMMTVADALFTAGQRQAAAYKSADSLGVYSFANVVPRERYWIMHRHDWFVGLEGEVCKDERKYWGRFTPKTAIVKFKASDVKAVQDNVVRTFKYDHKWVTVKGKIPRTMLTFYQQLFDARETRRFRLVKTSGIFYRKKGTKMSSPWGVAPASEALGSQGQQAVNVCPKHEQVPSKIEIAAKDVQATNAEPVSPPIERPAEPAKSVLALLNEFSSRPGCNRYSSKSEQVKLLGLYLWMRQHTESLDFEMFLSLHSQQADYDLENLKHPEDAIARYLPRSKKKAIDQKARQWTAAEVADYVALYVDMIREAEGTNTMIPMPFNDFLQSDSLIAKFIAGDFKDKPNSNRRVT